MLRGELTVVYTRHPDLRMTAVDHEGVVLHLGSRRYFAVNETGRTILQSLEQPRSLLELVATVMNEYDVDADVAGRTTREFIDRCVEAKLLRMEER